MKRIYNAFIFNECALDSHQVRMGRRYWRVDKKTSAKCVGQFSGISSIWVSQGKAMPVNTKSSG